jgi:leucyl/phenylalanyl-tRNA--protein transferase
VIAWLREDSAFPPLSEALAEPNGLLAAGGDLSPARLLDAYRRGIFPWYDEEPILWWSPDPRMALFPGELHVSRSLAKTLRQGRYEVRLDTAFAQVLAGCAGGERAVLGTWLTPEMAAAYLRLHELGYAHSVETWVDGELAGGLYGVAVGRLFCGESMFTRRTDASKIAVAHLVAHLTREGYRLIDCQMQTGHLASLGARPIARWEYAALIAGHTAAGPPPGRWPAAAVRDAYRAP